MKLYKRYFAFAVILGLICSVLYHPIPVYASDLIDDLVYYALSVSGYMETELSYSSGGGGHSFGKPVNNGTKIKRGENKDKGLLSTLRDAFQNAYDNHNISVDDSGNYIFDETITNNFYNIVNGGGVGGFTAQYFAGNPSFSDATTHSYSSGDYYNKVQNAYANFPEYLALCYGPYVYKNAWGPKNTCTIQFFNLQNVAYIGFNGNNIQFFDENFSVKSVTYSAIGCTQGNSATVQNGKTSSIPDRLPPHNFSGCLVNGYEAFPNNTAGLWNGNSPAKFTVNRPIIVGSNEANARGAYLFMQNPDCLTSKTYNIFPTITGDQFNNTKWQDCYNSYVNNVNNHYNENNTEWNTDLFLESMNIQNQLIIDTINNGISDVTGAVETLNEKVQRVLETIKEIKEIIENGGSGGSSDGGGSSFTDEQITQLLNDVKTLSENQVTSSTFDETLNTVNEYLKQISDNTEYNHSDLVELNDNLEKLYNFLLYGDNEKGFDSPYDLIKNLYETVATLSGEISIIKNDNSQLALTTADILQKLKDISEKETKDYTTKLNDLLASIDLINDNLNQYTEDEMLEIQSQGEALETIRRFVSDLVDDNGIIMESLGDIELNTRNLEGLLLDIKKNTEGLKKRGIDIDFNPDVDFQYPDKVQNLIDTFIDEALQTAMQAAVPICFLTALGVLIDMLSVEPVAPDFTIPFAVSGTSFGASIGESVSDYEVNIDLSEWEKPHQLVENLYCILFILLLIYMTFRLVKWAVSVFG